MMGGGEIHLNYDLNRIKYVIMNIMLKHKAVDHMQDLRILPQECSLYRRHYLRMQSLCRVQLESMMISSITLRTRRYTYQIP